MNEIYVTGHRNPDTDSVVASATSATRRSVCSTDSAFVRRGR